MADDVITDPDDPRIPTTEDLQAQTNQWPDEPIDVEAQAPAQDAWPDEPIDLREANPDLVTFYYPQTREATRAAGLSYAVEGGVQGGAGFSDVDLRDHTLEKYDAGESDYVATAMPGRPTGEEFVLNLHGKPRVHKNVDTGGGLIMGQMDVATSTPQLAKTGTIRPTGKKVNLETFTPIEMTPTQFIETRRAHAVDPEQEPWPDQPIDVAPPEQPTVPIDQVPSLEQQTVYPEPTLDPLVSGDLRSRYGEELARPGFADPAKLNLSPFDIQPEYQLPKETPQLEEPNFYDRMAEWMTGKSTYQRGAEARQIAKQVLADRPAGLGPMEGDRLTDWLNVQAKKRLVSPETIRQSLTPPTGREESEIEAGIKDTLAELGSGFTTAEGASQLPLLLIRPVRLAMGMGQLGEVPGDFREAARLSGEGNTRESAAAATRGVVNTLMGGAMLYGGSEIRQRTSVTIGPGRPNYPASRGPGGQLPGGPITGGIPMLPGRGAPARAALSGPLPLLLEDIHKTVDNTLALRTQTPEAEPGINSNGEFIDVPFVKLESTRGTIGDRVKAFLDPPDGTRPSQGLELAPGEPVPALLLGYPLINHANGSRTVINPADREESQQGPNGERVITIDPTELLTPAAEPPPPGRVTTPYIPSQQLELRLDKLASQDKIDGTVAAGADVGSSLQVQTPAQVLHDLESIGITEEERARMAGPHYVVANPATGEIRDLFIEREDGLDYLRTVATPGEALIRRQEGKPDQIVARLPDDVVTMQDREIVKAKKATGKSELSGTDWDNYLAPEVEAAVAPDVAPEVAYETTKTQPDIVPTVPARAAGETRTYADPELQKAHETISKQSDAEYYADDNPIHKRTEELIHKRVREEAGTDDPAAVLDYYVKKYGIKTPIRIQFGREGAAKADLMTKYDIATKRPLEFVIRLPDIRPGSRTAERYLSRVRHEIEHAIDIEQRGYDFLKADPSNREMVINRPEKGETIIGGIRRHTKGHHSQFEHFELDYLRDRLGPPKPTTPTAGVPLKFKGKGEGGFVNPEVFQEAADFGRRIYERGMDYGRWAGQMLKRFGEAIRDYLKDIWAMIRGSAPYRAWEEATGGRLLKPVRDVSKNLDLSKPESFIAVDRVVPVEKLRPTERGSVGRTGPLGKDPLLTSVDSGGQRRVGKLDRKLKFEPKLMDAASPEAKTYYRTSNLLGTGIDPKTVKGEKFGVRTYIMYLSAHTGSGVVNVCKFATESCSAGCLGKGGMGTFDSVKQARINKTKYWHYDPEVFHAQLDREITKAKAKAKAEGIGMAVRLNGTSDILWEKSGLMEKHPDLQFYDYTKYPSVLRKNLPHNYHLTYSYTGLPGSEAFSKTWAEKGVNTAVVFRDGMPAKFLDRPVIDGDVSDLRFQDPKGVIVGLHAKGKLIAKDKNGNYKEQDEFVYDTPPEDVAIPYVNPQEKARIVKTKGEAAIDTIKDAAPKAGDLKWKRGNPTLGENKPTAAPEVIVPSPGDIVVWNGKERTVSKFEPPPRNRVHFTDGTSGPWSEKMGEKIKRQAGRAGAIPNPFKPIAEAIKRAISRSRLKDVLLTRAGAPDVISNQLSWERSNLIRRDFGTVKDAMYGGNKVIGKPASKAFRDLEALTVIEEAGFDRAELQRDRQKVATAPTKEGRALVAKYDYALTEFDRIAHNPGHGRSEMDAQRVRENHAGIPTQDYENYAPHMYEQQPKGLFQNLFRTSKPGSGTGSARWFTKGRMFPKLADAIHAGKIPKSMNFADLAQVRIRDGQRLILQKYYREKLATYSYDGKPVAVDAPRRGYQTISINGTPVHVHEDLSNYVAMLFEPSAVRRSATGRGALTVVGTQKQGILGLDTFHGGRLSMYGFGAGKGRTRFGYKRGTSVLELAPEDYNRAIASGEYSPAEVAYARQKRPLMLELLAQNAQVARWGDNIIGDLHRVIPGLRGLNHLIFDSIGRGALMQGLIANYERILSRFPELSREQAARKAVIEMNELFGNLGRRSIFKHKTFQDLGQFLLLARNWVESQLRSEVRAYGQIAAYPYNVARGLLPERFGGVTPRGMGAKAFTRLGVTAQARLSLVLGLFVAGQILNYILNQESTFENKEGHKLDLKIPKGFLGLKKNYYVNPSQIPFEFTHQMTKYLHKGEGLLGAAAHIAFNKLPPGFRGGIGAVTGEPYPGSYKSKPGIERVRQVAAQEIPVPIVAGGLIEPEPRSPWLFRWQRKPDAALLQAGASFGIKAEPEESPRDEVYRMVREKGFEKPGEEHPSGKYSQLKRTLADKDPRALKEEFHLLMQEAPTRKDKLKMLDGIKQSLGVKGGGPANPLLFTGRVEDESKFKGKLTPSERLIYLKAQDEHRANARFFKMYEPILRTTEIR